MIICTGCGQPNDDDNRFCDGCGRKLQSSRNALPDAPGDARLDRFEHKGLSPARWTSLKKMAEAWVYLIALAAVGGVCLYTREWWPMYPAVGLLALTAVLRKI